MKKLELDVDYIIVDGRLVFTKDYLLRRGWCCNKGCLNCPYVELDKRK